MKEFGPVLFVSLECGAVIFALYLFRNKGYGAALYVPNGSFSEVIIVPLYIKVIYFVVIIIAGFLLPLFLSQLFSENIAKK